MRFVGQAFEVPVPLDVDELPGVTTADLLARFREAHHQVFEFGDSGHDRAEIVSFRVGASASSGALPSLAEPHRASTAEGRAVVFDRGAETSCRLLTRAALPAGDPVPGPVLVDDATATIYIPDGWSGARDPHDNLVLTRTSVAETAAPAEGG
jgi:N-methylhydantoinase A